MGASPTTYHQQFIHGTQYIDEIIMMRAVDRGDMYVHQDANWNVIGTTDLAASIVVRNVYTPYGQLTVNQETNYGDRDGDGDVDATDKGTPGTTCTGTVTGACRILDLDFDGDYDSADATKFDALTQGIARHPARTASATNQPVAHQGLLFEPEIASYQNRNRFLRYGMRRYATRDPLVNTAQSGSGFQDGMNIYGYLLANSLSNIDPLGLDCCTSSNPDNPNNPDPDNLGWVCCDSDKRGGCKVLQCIDPDFENAGDPNLVKCVKEHEKDHVGRTGCVIKNCLCTETNTMSRNLDECFAYRAEARCLSDNVNYSSPETDSACNWVSCMIDRLCAQGNNDYLTAVNWCNAKSPGYSGCNSANINGS